VLHGRDVERARLVALVDAARQGRAASLVLHGEPGVGKSALLADALADASGVQVLRIQGMESESPLAFAALHRLLRPVWRLRSLVSGTAVMLGVTGLLVGAVFLTSIYVQTVLGFSALQAGLAFLPFAFSITVGTIVARHVMAHATPRVVAAVGLVLVAGASVLLATATASSHYVSGVLPGLVVLGTGVGMVFVPVSVTSMAGIPASHAGVASGFLMTGHEVGAALGVAVLSALASTAGSLTGVNGVDGVVDAFSRGFVAAAVIAVLVAVVAFWRMPSTRSEAGAGMHMHH